MITAIPTVVSKVRIFALAALMTCSVAQADDVSTADRVLCSVSELMLCVEDGECYPMSVLDLDVPQFIVVDLKKQTIKTTDASADTRESKVANLARENGRTFLQGVEDNRAYSLLIEEDLGRLTGAVARDGITISVFGACTNADVR